jgi:hypothetical protein
MSKFLLTKHPPHLIINLWQVRKVTVLVHVNDVISKLTAARYCLTFVNYTIYISHRRSPCEAADLGTAKGVSITSQYRPVFTCHEMQLFT